MLFLICIQGIFGMFQVIFVFPRVVRCWIAFPSDQILPLVSFSSVRHNGFYFKLFFVIYKIWWRSYKIRSVSFVLVIRGNKRNVENGVYFPSWWKFKFHVDRSKYFCNLERSFSSWREFSNLSNSLQVLRV